MAIREVTAMNPEVLRNATKIASGQLMTRFSVILKRLGLDDEHGPLAAAGALCLADLGNWACQHGLLGEDTTALIQNLALETVAALQTLGGIDGE